MTIRAVVSMLEEVIYPARMYRASAIRAGADLLRKWLRIEVGEALDSYYVPGAEELAVRAALEEHFAVPDVRLVAKTAAVMASHATRVSTYADVPEVFPVLQAMDIPLGLIADGPPRAQRIITGQLRVDRIFSHVVYANELLGDHPLEDALDLIELMTGCALEETAMICSRSQHARLAARRVGRVYRLFRRPPQGCRQSANTGITRIIPMINLYDLPEALGLIAWPESPSA